MWGRGTDSCPELRHIGASSTLNFGSVCPSKFAYLMLIRTTWITSMILWCMEKRPFLIYRLNCWSCYNPQRINLESAQHREWVSTWCCAASWGIQCCSWCHHEPSISAKVFPYIPMLPPQLHQYPRFSGWKCGRCGGGRLHGIAVRLGLLFDATWWGSSRVAGWRLHPQLMKDHGEDLSGDWLKSSTKSQLRAKGTASWRGPCGMLVRPDASQPTRNASLPKPRPILAQMFFGTLLVGGR